MNHIEIKRFSEDSLLINWPAAIDSKTSEEVIAASQRLATKNIVGIWDIIPSYHSLLVSFDQRLTNHQQVEDELLDILSNQPSSERGRTWEIPVHYDGEDLSYVCDQLKMSKAKLIAEHSKPLYNVYFIGFLPGFLYLGDLPDQLAISRRKTPRAKVPKGAVAIGGAQTGIYPSASPGGWQLIGRTEMEWFDLDFNPPSKIKAGDIIKFIPQ